METTLGYPSPADQRRREARLELALVLGGTVGAVAVMSLRMAGKTSLANSLTLLGLVTGGVVGMIRVANRYPDV